MIDLTHILTLDVKKRLGEKVKQCRKRCGISQFELAERIEMSETAIAMLERGERWPRLETLQAIADIVGVTVDAFFASEIVVVKPTPQEALKVLQDFVNGAKSRPAVDEDQASGPVKGVPPPPADVSELEALIARMNKAQRRKLLLAAKILAKSLDVEDVV